MTQSLLARLIDSTTTPGERHGIFNGYKLGSLHDLRRSDALHWLHNINIVPKDLTSWTIVFLWLTLTLPCLVQDVED